MPTIVFVSAELLVHCEWVAQTSAAWNRRCWNLATSHHCLISSRLSRATADCGWCLMCTIALCFSGAATALRACCTTHQWRGAGTVGTQRRSWRARGQPERPCRPTDGRHYEARQTLHCRQQNIYVCFSLTLTVTFPAIRHHCPLTGA